ncbi:GntR family transcriptional regulator [Thermodesulfobacteriota bacterium]
MKNEIVYDHLYTAIINGDLKQGQRIVIRKVAQEMGVSDIPVREALKALVAIGLVGTHPHSGAFVKEISLNEVEEMFMILSELECLAAINAIDYFSDKDFRLMEALIKKSKRLIEKELYLKYWQLNREFHLLIVKATPFRILENTISDFYSKTEVVRNAFFRSKKDITDSFNEQLKILDALRNKKKDTLVPLIKDHNFRRWESVRPD